MTLVNTLVGNLVGSGTPIADWRLTSVADGIQAAFRLGAGNAYATLVGSDADDLTDSIPSDRKASAHAPYVIQAPSAGQRPGLDGAGLRYVAGSASMLSGAADLAGAMRAADCTVIVYAKWLNPAPATSTIACSIGDTAVDNQWWACANYFTSAPASIRAVRQAGGFQVATSATGMTLGANHMTSSVFDAGAGTLTAYLDAVAGTPNGTTRTPAAADAFAIGGLIRATPAEYASLTVYEVQVYLEKLDAARQAAILAQLAAEYG